MSKGMTTINCDMVNSPPVYKYND